MSSLATSSPVSASTFEYLIRWPVFRFSWLNEIFSDSEVAGYSAIGQVTSERRRKPFQFARGAMDAVLHMRDGSDSRRTDGLGSDTPWSIVRYVFPLPRKMTCSCPRQVSLLPISSMQNFDARTALGPVTS